MPHRPNTPQVYATPELQLYIPQSLDAAVRRSFLGAKLADRPNAMLTTGTLFAVTTNGEGHSATSMEKTDTASHAFTTDAGLPLVLNRCAHLPPHKQTKQLLCPLLLPPGCSCPHATSAIPSTLCQVVFVYSRTDSCTMGLPNRTQLDPSALRYMGGDGPNATVLIWPNSKATLAALVIIGTHSDGTNLIATGEPRLLLDHPLRPRICILVRPRHPTQGDRFPCPLASLSIYN